MKSEENNLKSSQQQTQQPDISWLERWEARLAFDYGFDKVEDMDTAELSIVQHLKNFLKYGDDCNPTQEGT